MLNLTLKYCFLPNFYIIDRTKDLFIDFLKKSYIVRMQKIKILAK